MTNQEKLTLIAAKINTCKKCPQLVEDRIKTVPGQGNFNAEIVLLGEGPGRTESETGLAFCGRAGQLLTNILKACELDREDIFITNIVKCRPPNNRVPTDEECKNCRGFLDLQLKVINPKYIVCLGSTAAQNLLGVSIPIGQLRGKWYNYKNSKVICTFHPSYLLRNPSAKKDSWEDLQLLLSDINKSSS